MAVLLNASIIYNYIEKSGGPVHDHFTQNGFISKLVLVSERPSFLIDHSVKHLTL